ncbi:hypothetical protein O4215_14540 [Rhodococcus maanshanensis]|uniref:hypothetical protein n=1 Tax=Rhodococcus maanshanensis TaxID=183556 RepID=UPI0022B4FFD4|nr:hypothetical protein [Rhodococcus maanshanensis]MCZ4556787.1 hypothetical protein [Rhodococcus maanshanensis]
MALIGVLGAGGAVGRAVLDMLVEHRVRPGVRADGDDLRRWSAGCAVVINCTGLSLREEILSAGSHYVDPAARDAGPEIAVADRVAVHDAGAMPGAAGLLPRYLAASLHERPARLAVEAGGLYRFTPASAREFLGARHGWRDQAVRVNRALGLAGSDWTTRFDGECVRQLLCGSGESTTEVTVDNLIAAAAADAAGRTEYLTITAELTGEHGTVRTVRLRAGPELTARVAVITAHAVLRGEIPPGTHSADDVLDPLRVVPKLLSEEGTV